jgi:murein L,D-transpeptidase YcbB/YkuD
MAVNGRLPASALRPIPGGRLAKAPALRWNAMCAHLLAHGHAVPMPNGPVSSYRTFLEQVALKAEWTRRGHPENAATPGTSNHGWGRAVDTNQGATVDSVPRFGFDKSHSDAPWESWHRTWGGLGSTAGGEAFAFELHVIRRGSHGLAVRHLQVLLRGAGYLPRRWRAHTKYTLAVRRAVRQFQRKHNMQVDGIVGPATWKAIRAAYERRQH